MKIDAFEQSAQSENAEQLFLQARYDECLSALSGDEGPQAQFLRARIMLRLGQHAELLRSGFYFHVGDLPRDFGARSQVVLSAALFRSDMRRQAALMLDAAKRSALQHGDALALAEATYHEALQQWSSGNVLEASKALDEPIAWGRVEAQRRELRAAIAASSGKHAEQIAHLRAALECLASTPTYDVWVAAWCTHTLAAMARELYSRELATFTESWVARIPWTTHLSRTHCQALRCVGWFHATAGAGPIAYDYFFRSAYVAPSDAFKALTLLDRAYMAFGMGEHSSAMYYTSQADRIMSKIDWESVTGDERFALLLAAELAAPQSPTRAAFFEKKFHEIATPMSTLLAYGRSDARPNALINYTRGIVLRANGECREAARSFDDAFRAWRSAGYTWRSVLAAIHLGELQHKDALLDYARVSVEKEFPHIWFRRLLTPHRDRLADGRLSVLSESERKLFVMTLKGKHRAEIAAELQISENTVRNRTTSMLRKLSVKSTRDLLVKFASVAT